MILRSLIVFLYHLMFFFIPSFNFPKTIALRLCCRVTAQNVNHMLRNLQPYTGHITDFNECNLLKQFFSSAPLKCELPLQSCSKNMKAEWNFSENLSNLVAPSFPKEYSSTVSGFVLCVASTQRNLTRQK